MRDFADQYSVFYERAGIMEVISEYILSVVCTAILCGIIMLLCGKCAAGALKLVLGIVMTVAVLKPVITEDIFSYDLSLDVQEDSSEIISEGSMVAASMQSEIITHEIQAYILDKAEALGANITVDVDLGEDHLPESICLSGQVTPYTKKQLEHIILTQLGVRKECLSWQ